MSKVKTNLDLIQWLGDDMSTKVFSYLDDPRDLIHVSVVSKSWEKIVIQNDLCKRLCLKMFPEISGVVHSIEVDNVIELDGNLLERNHKIYACLAFGLSPIRNDCISKSLFASTTNDDWEENFKNTLEPGDGNEDGPSYWSSIGQSDPSIPEALVYKLCSNICLVSEIHIQPYQDYFEDDCPIYSAKAVRFRLGCERHDMEVESNTVVPDSLTFNEDFKWTYTSPVFPMSHDDMLQTFKLPEPVLFGGDVLLVELLGRIKEKEDSLFYICISHVQVVGRTISPAFIVRKCERGRCSLRYFPHKHRGVWCRCRFIGGGGRWGDY